MASKLGEKSRTMTRVPGSFRDSAGHVFCASGRIFRGIAPSWASEFRKFIQSEFFKKRAGKQIVNTKEVSPEEVREARISEDDIPTLWYVG